MKIGSTPDTPPAVDLTARGPARAGATSATARVASTEKVDVSATGAQMGAAPGAADFDGAKVDAIRQAIREGRFTVNPGAIADRLIADATALLGPKSAKP